jgi:hypothetical protein
MKTRNPLAFYLALAFSAMFARLTLPVHGQTYSFSAPVTGYFGLDIMDYSPQDGGAPTIGTASTITLNTLTETLYYDPVTQTLRQMGSVSLNVPTNVTLSFIEHVHVNSSPQTATVTVNFSFPPILSFDTGFQASSGATNEFIIAPPTIPITGTYSILAGDQTLTGLFNYSLLFPSLVTDVSAITPASLVISQTPIGPMGFFAPNIARSVTAANGMEFNLVGGISDGTYRSSWSLNPVTAIAVPEPGFHLLFGLGLLVLGLGACRCPATLGRNG